eukprot:431652-Prorocentrum_lima.AAC.1
MLDDIKRRRKAREVWLRNAKVWKRMLPIDPDRPQLGSWLRAAIGPGTQLWGAGCIVCAADDQAPSS